ncbi:MAG: glycosyltransferase family 39 protein [Planctomycetota bacterium]
MTASPPGTIQPTDAIPRHSFWWHVPIVLLLLGAAGTLAVTSMLGDSITYDETSHLTAGMSYLKTGDYRLAPDHPPLAKLWAAWPLLLTDQTWVPDYDYGWQNADVYLAGRAWLFELNDGEELLLIARGMIVILLLALCLSTYALGRVLFGPGAGLLALVLAALSPTLLAHGRLVTTDLPITLCLTLTLLTVARVLQRVTWGRLLACVLALGAASVTKLSWPLILPVLAIMAFVAIVRRKPIEIPQKRLRHETRSQPATWLELYRRRHCAGAVMIIGLFLVVTTFVSIWTTYRWRISMFAEPSATDSGKSSTSTDHMTELLAGAWHRALHDDDGQPRTGVVPTFVKWASEWHVLPDAYLFGLAWTLESTRGRNAYFCGEHATTGWSWYFPVVFAIKTPIATVALLLAGLVALLAFRTRCREPVLLIGLIVFIGVHLAYVMSSNFNIGQRHLLPIYPALFVLAGASVVWFRTVLGGLLGCGLLIWLGAANYWIHPHYLSYFNEAIGGPRQGHHYLADSNIDWGQDLKRLAAYAEEHPYETIKLSYFGSAVPSYYVQNCTLLPSSIDTGSATNLDGGGTYVISVTHLLGVYDQTAQEEFWQDPHVMQYYRELHSRAHRSSLFDFNKGRKREQTEEQYTRLRWGRFLINLRQRPPDERIGYSLFVYHLGSMDVDELTQP